MLARPYRGAVIEFRVREHGAPVSSAVGATKQFVARRVARKSGGHHHLRIARIDGYRTPAEALSVLRRARHRRHFGPALRGRLVFPHRASMHGIGTGFVAVAQVITAVTGAHHMVGTQARRLARHGLPAAPAIVGAEQAGLAGGHTRIERRRRLARLTARGLEHHEHDADGLAPPAVFRARPGRCRNRGKAVYPCPVRGTIVASPQPGTARAEEQHAAIVRVYRQPLTVAAPQLVATQFERQVRAFEMLAAIG